MLVGPGVIPNQASLVTLRMSPGRCLQDTPPGKMPSCRCGATGGGPARRAASGCLPASKSSPGDELAQAELRQRRRIRNVFAERHEMGLVVGIDDRSVVRDDLDGVVVELLADRRLVARAAPAISVTPGGSRAAICASARASR